MASAEQVASSDFIKNIHQQLRNETKILGIYEAWQKHCENEENLRRYASEMHNLATNHWEKNYGNTKATSRVEWAVKFCKQYFLEEVLKHRQKEMEIAHKVGLKVTQISPCTNDKTYKLLDVGSCYNPFQKYELFDVLPIDIAPATSDVYKCDFLNLKVHSSVCSVYNSNTIKYLPCPSQRLLCCKKAYNLLKTEGILIIITPDSKHVGANAKIMKSWRFILAKLGFSRIKYEKLEHLHCMVFRKNLKPEIAQRWALLQNTENFYSEFVIPQDFKNTEQSLAVADNYSCCESSLFEELPNFVE